MLTPNTDLGCDKDDHVVPLNQENLFNEFEKEIDAGPVYDLPLRIGLFKSNCSFARRE